MIPPLFATALAAFTGPLAAQETAHLPSEFDLKLPPLDSVTMLGMNGHQLLMGGIVICILGLVFGMVSYGQLKRLPVHSAMREVSELIYETCKTYLFTQMKFIGILWAFIAAVIAAYFFGIHGKPVSEVLMILAFSLIGIAGSVAVAAFGIRVNTFANSARRSRRCAASRTRSTRSRSRPACRSGCCSSRSSSS